MKALKFIYDSLSWLVGGYLLLAVILTALQSLKGTAIWLGSILAGVGWLPVTLMLLAAGLLLLLTQFVELRAIYLSLVKIVVIAITLFILLLVFHGLIGAGVWIFTLGSPATGVNWGLVIVLVATGVMVLLSRMYWIAINK